LAVARRLQSSSAVNRLVLAVIAVAVLGRSAASEPVRYYVGAGGSAAGDEWLYMTGYVDGGLRLPAHNLWLRGRLAHGGAGDIESSGTVTEASVGIDGRRCTTTARLCGALGIAIGRLEGNVTNEERGMSWDPGATVLSMRGAGEVAISAHLAIQLALELRRIVQVADPATSATAGAGISIGIVWRR
jgi:hypothetical protein